MPSNRRIRFYGVLLVLAIIITIYWTSAAKTTRSSEFYTRTSAALQQNEADAAKLRVEQEAAKAKAKEDMKLNLKASEEKAKKSALEKGDRLQQQVIADMAKKEKEKAEEAQMVDSKEDKHVAGRVKYTNGKDDGTLGVATVGGNPASKDNPLHENETEEEHEIETELNSILKKSPIIIFSKTYCPFSKKAKKILLERYKITPAPYVVELDEHRLGRGLQDALGKMTNRKTVPNILINALSIGGGDDIEALHLEHELAKTIFARGGKRITEVKPIAPEDDEEKKDGLRRRRRLV